MEEVKLQRLVEHLSLEKFGRPFLHKAYFNKRLKSTGGRYLLATHDIELNYKMYEHFGEQELIGIILHELCHYHLHIQGRGYKHRDKDFRELLKAVGAPRFCSSLPIEKKRVVAIHTYQCTSCSLLYKRKRRFNVNKYRCGKCAGKLKMIVNHRS